MGIETRGRGEDSPDTEIAETHTNNPSLSSFTLPRVLGLELERPGAGNVRHVFVQQRVNQKQPVVNIISIRFCILKCCRCVPPTNEQYIQKLFDGKEFSAAFIYRPNIFL